MKEKTKNKRVSRLLAFGLALAMFQPLGIRAEDTPTRIPEPFTNSEVAASTAEEPEIGNEVTADFVAVAEAEDRRGMYERHFLCEDGSYVAIHYGYPVNYPDEEGEWKEIDNTLTTVSDDEGNQVVENKDGLFDVRFSVDGEGEELVSMEQDGHILSWNVTAITDVDTILDSLEKEEIDTETAARVFGKAEKKAEKEEAKEAKKAEREEQKAALGLKDAKHGKVNAPGQIRKKDTSAMTKTERLTSAHKAGSAIVYEEAFGMENVDVAYEISPTAVKENIILNSVSEITSYEVEMTAGGMTATLEEDGSITFADEAGEMAFEVAAPVMYDASVPLDLRLFKDIDYNSKRGYRVTTENPNRINGYGNPDGVPLLFQYCNELNNFLESIEKNYIYIKKGESNYKTEEDFIQAIVDSLKNECPVVVLMKTVKSKTDTTEVTSGSIKAFDCATPGHYIVVTGVKVVENEIKFIYNDPYYGFETEDVGQGRMVASKMLYTCSSYIIVGE